MGSRPTGAGEKFGSDTTRNSMAAEAPEDTSTVETEFLPQDPASTNYVGGGGGGGDAGGGGGGAPASAAAPSQDALAGDMEAGKALELKGNVAPAGPGPNPGQNPAGAGEAKNEPPEPPPQDTPRGRRASEPQLNALDPDRIEHARDDFIAGAQHRWNDTWKTTAGKIGLCILVPILVLIAIALVLTYIAVVVAMLATHVATRIVYHLTSCCGSCCLYMAADDDDDDDRRRRRRRRRRDSDASDAGCEGCCRCAMGIIGCALKCASYTSFVVSKACILIAAGMTSNECLTEYAKNFHYGSFVDDDIPDL